MRSRARPVTSWDLSSVSAIKLDINLKAANFSSGFSFEIELGLLRRPASFDLGKRTVSLPGRDRCTGSSLAEPLKVECFYELWQRQFPRLLRVVVDLAKLRWIHSQFACHLQLHVRQMMALSRIDPRLHLLIWLSIPFGHTITVTLGATFPNLWCLARHLTALPSPAVAGNSPWPREFG